ncbi:hypothetical protein GCM10009678_67520 [Actinomadura kijaniata]|uniref:Uncharacterized protein n=1 Tax=Actinomadura namibiensis TaxID=182080 RepID=A0A7W3QPQ3_ACTNM|nr:hypothetical protein [Actinomadura namibiensis]MBA8954806.1 hypothetical protein [Actinomadura namibiensis]
MTTPEENRPKTGDTDQVVMRPGGDPDRRADQESGSEPDTRPSLGAELEDKMAERGVTREDLTGS